MAFRTENMMFSQDVAERLHFARNTWSGGAWIPFVCQPASPVTRSAFAGVNHNFLRPLAYGRTRDALRCPPISAPWALKVDHCHWLNGNRGPVLLFPAA